MFVCNRSGRAIDRSTGQRANWAKGYTRLDKCCSSFCHAQLYPKCVRACRFMQIVCSGRVHVEFCTEHTHGLDETSKSRPVISEACFADAQLYDDATGSLRSINQFVNQSTIAHVGEVADVLVESDEPTTITYTEVKSAVVGGGEQEDVDVTNYDEESSMNDLLQNDYS